MAQAAGMVASAEMEVLVEMAAVVMAAGVARVARAEMVAKEAVMAGTVAKVAREAVADFEGRSRCSRCRGCNPNIRLRIRHRRTNHPRRRCTSPCRSARWRSPPPG